jgi:hypothetical protein
MMRKNLKHVAAIALLVGFVVLALGSASTPNEGGGGTNQLPAPQNLTVTEEFTPSARSIIVSWSAVGGATGYKVAIYRLGTGGKPKLGEWDTSETTFTIPGDNHLLQPGGWYSVEVKSLTGSVASKSAASAQVTMSEGLTQAEQAERDAQEAASQENIAASRQQQELFEKQLKQFHGTWENKDRCTIMVDERNKNIVIFRYDNDNNRVQHHAATFQTITENQFSARNLTTKVNWTFNYTISGGILTITDIVIVQIDGVIQTQYGLYRGAYTKTK